MNDYQRKHDACDTPASQPKPPGGDCASLPSTTPPTLQPPAPCPAPPTNCKCPGGSSPTPTCLDSLIDEQKKQIAEAEAAASLLKDLDAIRTDAKTAGQAYTVEAHENLLKRWREQDGKIADLIRQLVCNLPCWRCVIECYVCPLINDVVLNEKWLYGDGSLIPQVGNLYDLRYWHERNKEARSAVRARVESVVQAWAGKTGPAASIKATLDVNEALWEQCKGKYPSEPAKVAYDLFLTLIPRHLAIAPPAGSGNTTRIDKKYTVFCECDLAKPDDCCGPDTAAASVRQRLLGAPLPYLIHPADYLKLVCCLVEKRYLKAREAANAADAAYLAVDNEIKRRQDAIKQATPTWIEDTAKGRMPSVIDCCDSDHNSGGAVQSR